MSSRRRIARLQLRRKIDVQARTGVARQRLRHVDAQCYDGKAQSKTDARRIFEAIAKVIESVAVIEKRRHAKVTWQVPDDLNGTGNEIFAAVLHRSLLYGIGGRKLIESKAAHAVVAAGEEPHDGRQPVEMRYRGHADLIAQ